MTDAPTQPRIPPAYRRALQNLADAFREAEALALLLDHFAAALRGKRPDPDDPPLEVYPGPGQVRRALTRLDLALDGAREAWAELPADAREEVQAPEDAFDMGR